MAWNEISCHFHAQETVGFESPAVTFETVILSCTLRVHINKCHPRRNQHDTQLPHSIVRTYYPYLYFTSHLLPPWQRTFYLLGKGGYVFGGVGLSVCLFVDNITQKVMNGSG